MSYNKIFSFAVPGMAFDGDTYKERSLGGSETAGLFLPRALAELGHTVYVFSNAEKYDRYDGVYYFPLSQWKEFAYTTPHDVSVVQRIPAMLSAPTQAKLNFLWLHDLVQPGDEKSYKGVAWNLDQALTVSQFHKEQAQGIIGLDDNFLTATRNGIDLELVDQARKEAGKRDRKKLVYSARPERGLDVLLEQVFPDILGQDPEAWLCITGYSNPVNQLEDFYNYIGELIERFGDRIVVNDNLTKKDLYKEYLTAGCYIYPTPSPRMPDFREVSCISAMEAMACGLPFVSYAGGALPETVHPQAGTLIESQPNEYPEAYAQAALAYMNNDLDFMRAHKAGIEYSQKLDWRGVAQEWDQLVERLIEERNDSPDRLVRHFVKRSNIEPAKEINNRYNLGFNFENWDYDLEEHYQENHEVLIHYDESANDGRLQTIKNLLPESGNILDFGCGVGVHSVEFAKQSEDVRANGVDISLTNIAISRSVLEEFGQEVKDRVSFEHGNEDTLLPMTYDVAVLGEVLEHQPKPWEVLDKVEKSVVPGGKIIITVPYGPWEFGGSENHHLWEIDPHCIWEMMGHKSGLMMGYKHEGSNSETGEPVGYHVISYKVDHKEIRPIDIDRVIEFQNPKQTVSACIMAGPKSEESLRWHLNSYGHLMDQIVVADTGMSEEARSIFREYNALFVEAPNPKEYGFEVPRNTALQFCDKDWVFWMDTDEKLIDYPNLSKYLKENCYQGYGVKQHHFAIDTDFNADMPVRLFRRRPIDGKEVRWCGMIHEHPETNINEGPGPVVVASDLNIAHLGYLNENIRRDRFWRNYPLLQKDIETYPDRLLQKHFICRDSILLAGYILERNGGLVDEQVKEFCERTIGTFREYFLGQKQGFANINTQQYYQSALEILDTGIVVGPELGFPENTRFLNKEDLEKEINVRLEKIEEQ